MHGLQTDRRPQLDGTTVGYLTTNRASACGRVLPATSLARAAAVQRIAGIQCPVAVGSVRVWTERPPRVDRSSERSPLLMYFHRSTSGKLSDPLPCYCQAQRIRKRGRPARRIAWERKNLPSAQLDQSISRQAAWMPDLAAGIYRQRGNRLDGKFLAETRRDIFTVRLKSIPAIDLESYSHSIINKHSKLLTYKGSATASALFTVTFTVNLICASKLALRIYRHLSTPVGEPLRLRFRGLSTCIDLRSDHQERFQALPVV